MKQSITLTLVVLGLALSSGCAIGIGNRDHDTPHHTTLGQELIDLKTARDTGVISEGEFQEQRARLLD